MKEKAINMVPQSFLPLTKPTSEPKRYFFLVAWLFVARS